MNVPLLAFNEKGIYCARAGVYLDPWRPVDKAIISHGHAYHSRWGYKKYITHHSNVPFIKHRLGDIEVSGKAWNETFTINGGYFFFTSRRAHHVKNQLPFPFQLLQTDFGKNYLQKNLKIESGGCLFNGENDIFAA